MLSIHFLSSVARLARQAAILALPFVFPTRHGSEAVEVARRFCDDGDSPRFAQTTMHAALKTHFYFFLSSEGQMILFLCVLFLQGCGQSFVPPLLASTMDSCSRLDWV